jgi:hypothetical protein
MSPHPASEAAAVLATASTAAVGWSVGHLATMLGFIEITKEDLLGPVGALGMAVLAVVYFVRRQILWDKREEQREQRREQLIVQVTSIAEGSKTAIREMKAATERFDATAQKQIDSLRAVEAALKSCPKQNNNPT